MTESYCPECKQQQLFETPPCQDGHDDCVDLMCVDCGHAMTSYAVLLTEDVVLVSAA